MGERACGLIAAPSLRTMQGVAVLPHSQDRLGRRDEVSASDFLA